MKVKISELRPNNWFLSERKIETIRKVWDENEGSKLPPILVSKIDGVFAIIDGNSRAFVALDNGATQIEAIESELSMIDEHAALYLYLHRQAPDEGITSVADLRFRILSPEDYERQWVLLCSNLLQKFRDCTSSPN